MYLITMKCIIDGTFIKRKFLIPSLDSFDIYDVMDVDEADNLTIKIEKVGVLIDE